MIKKFLVFWFTGFLVLTIGIEIFAQEELLFMEIPVVVTASKREESVNKSPSVVYVITAEEIKLLGARNLAEAVNAIPGLRRGAIREGSVLGSRGFTSDQNDKFLILIDGTPIKNICQDGAYLFPDIPLLEMVDRIEVVKGPASTLWGSGASFGVINIITKKGENVDGLKLTGSYSTDDNFLIGNMLYGKNLTDGDYLISLTGYQSDGFAWNSDKGNTAYAWWVTDKDEVNPWVTGSVARPSGVEKNDIIRFVDFYPSYDFYGKLRVSDMTIKARAAYTSQAYLWNTVIKEKETAGIMKHSFVELEKNNKFSGGSTLTTKVNVHHMTYERGVPKSFDSPLETGDMETMVESGIGGELIYNMSVQKHNFVMGSKLDVTNIGPNTIEQFYLGDGTVTPIAGRGQYPLNKGYFITVFPKTDTEAGIYVEDSIDVMDKLTLVGGLSYEYNDLREVGGQVMPRAAVIYQLTDSLTAKYAYNTGYVRPPAQKKFGALYGHVTKSEKIAEHDVQLMFYTKKTKSSLTLYDYKIDDYFTWFDERKYDVSGNWVSGGVGHTNQGGAKGQGAEIDFKYILVSNFSVYLNYLYAKSVIVAEDGTESKINGEPEHVYNIGSQWYITKNVALNLNINGYMNMYHGKDGDKELYWSGSGEEVVNLALTAEELFSKPLSLTLFANNILDSKVHVSMTGWPGYTYGQNASYGLKISYKI